MNDKRLTYNEVNTKLNTNSLILILNSRLSIDISYYVVGVIYSTCILLHIMLVWYCRYIFLKWHCNLHVDVIDLKTIHYVFVMLMLFWNIHIECKQVVLHKLLLLSKNSNKNTIQLMDEIRYNSKIRNSIEYIYYRNIYHST